MLVSPYRHAKPIPVGVSTGQYLVGLDATTLGNILDAYVTQGATWVREAIAWATIQPTNSSTFSWTAWDALVTACNSRGLKIIATILGSPAWARPTTYAAGSTGSPPDSATTYGTFCTAAATRFSASIKTWEIWNEPNLKNFWGGFNSDPTYYYSLLAAGYDAIKAVDATATVITAGLGSSLTSGGQHSGIDFLDLVLTAGTTKQDGIGVHPYTYPLLPSSTFYDHPWRQLHLATPSYLSTMQAHGVGHLKFWVTEVGAPTSGPATGTITAGTAAVTETASATSLAATKPTLTALADVLLVAHYTGSAAPTSVPSGWTLIPSSAVTNSTWSSAGYYKLVLGANVAAEPATYTWGFTSSAATVIIRPYYGVNSQALLTPTTATTASNNNATTVAVGTVTTTVANALLVSGGGQNSTTSGSTALTVPSGMTSVGVSTGTGKSARLAEQTIATASATGSRTWTFNSGALGHGGWMIALRPWDPPGTRANSYGVDVYPPLPIYNDEQTQADIHDEAVRLARQRPDLFAHVDPYTIIDLDPPGQLTAANGVEGHFGMLESDGTAKDAWAAFGAAITDTGGPT